MMMLSRFSRVLTLCDPIDGSPPGSAIPGILQARTLEWVAISFSNAWKWKGKVKSLSCVWLFTTPWSAAYQAPLSMEFSRQEYWSGVPLPSPLPTTFGYYICVTSDWFFLQNTCWVYLSLSTSADTILVWVITTFCLSLAWIWNMGPLFYPAALQSIFHTVI